jgi:hypothetical protein
VYVTPNPEDIVRRDAAMRRVAMQYAVPAERIVSPIGRASSNLF